MAGSLRLLHLALWHPASGDLSLPSLKPGPQQQPLLSQQPPCSSAQVLFGRSPCSLSPGRPRVSGILMGPSNSAMAPPLSSPRLPHGHQTPRFAPQQQTRQSHSLQGNRGGHSGDPGDLILVSVGFVTYMGYKMPLTACTRKRQIALCRCLSPLCDCRRG